jgi:hypothetical protein
MIENRLDVPLTVVFINANGQEGSLIGNLPAHSQWPLDVFPSGLDHCTPGVMVARDLASGAEVARSPNPVCRPSQWTIEAPGESP